MVVFVKQGRSQRVSGACWRTDRIALMTNNKGKVCHARTLRWDVERVKLDGGYMEMMMPSPKWIRTLKQSCGMYDAMSTAERFCSTLIHEWGHIKDYQSGEYDRLNSNLIAEAQGKSRRTTWGDRPEERRANTMRDECQEKMDKGELPNVDNEVLNLALWLEQRQKDIEKENEVKDRKRLEYWNKLRTLKQTGKYMAGVNVEKLWERFKNEPDVIAEVEAQKKLTAELFSMKSRVAEQSAKLLVGII